MVEKTDKRPNLPEIEQLNKVIQRQFGKLAPAEKRWTGLIGDFSKTARISYGEQKNFTYCLINFRQFQFIGITKRMPTDEIDFKPAELIAVYRAAEDMAIYFSNK